jgi:(p)ppGpp synthase/HD superfamily hydrolase
VERLEQAQDFAIKAHEGQVRKLTGEPYVSHPIAVGKLLQQSGFDEDVVIAGYLHDTVEDTQVTFEDIEKRFGKRVVELVKGNTENKEHSWSERKQHTIDEVKDAPLEIKALIVADKLDNIQSLIDHYDELGEGIWEKFKGAPSQQKWYYNSVADSAFHGLENKDIPNIFYRLRNAVETLFD